MLGSLFALPAPIASALTALALVGPPAAEPVDEPATTEAQPLPDEGSAADIAAPERNYEGPTAVAPTGEVETVEPVAPEQPETPAQPQTPAEPEAPAAETSASASASVGGQPTTDTNATVETTTEVTPYVPASQPKREYPRVIQTITEFREDERASFGKRVKFYPGIQVRNQIGWVSPFTIDRFGNQYEEGAFSTGRIRWNPELRIKKNLKIVGMLDLANGRWAPIGSEDPIIDEIIDRGLPPGRTELNIVDPRELYVEYRFSLGVIRAGQQAFTWGQGILANNGNNIDRFGDLKFGDDGPGDIYERILIGTKPFNYRAGAIKHLAIAVGGDIVFRDERVNLLQGDLAGQALIVLRWQNDAEPWNWLGGYAVYRNQKTADDGDVYPDDNDLEVGAFDIGGQGVKWLGNGLQLIGGFEGAFITGRTTIARDEFGPHKIAQGGWAARGYVGKDKTWLVGFDTGYASGDPDSTDRFINNFTFDAGHTVGLVLFNQVNAWRTARTEMLATDGELTGVPLNGTQFIPTRGGVTNALYLHPKARYALWEKLEFWGGPLMALAPVPIVDPYTTRLNGGVPTNTVNGDGGRRYYGTELDLGIRGRFDLKNFWLQAGLQGGLLLPGPGIANQAGDPGSPVGAIWSRLELRY